jgi:hypothetical protein
MLSAEEKLAVEIAEVDRIEVNDVNLAEAGKHEILEQLAADAACSH